MKLFPPNPGCAPRRAFRGKRRYFRKVLRDAAAFRLEAGPDSWWDYWHYHADWKGWGNLGWSYRRQHLDALCQVFRRILDERHRIPRPFQLWIVLDAWDAGQDATYLHSPSPHGTRFPLQLHGVRWGVPELEAYVRARLPGLELVVGGSTHEAPDLEPPREVTSYFIYSPEIGIPLSDANG